MEPDQSGPLEKLAVVVFNLGGPDKPEAVYPFLRNLFSDPAILSVPGPIRYLLSRLIASRRAPIAREIYQELGGRSPIVPQTEDQTRDLTAELLRRGIARDVHCEIAMRYWHPMTDEAVRNVKAFDPDRIVLVPLYPQYSTTTSASSIQAWMQAAKRAGLTAQTDIVCCYPQNSGYIEASANLLRAALKAWSAGVPPRVLFSAHGLPERVVEGGDPYQWQVEQSAEAIVKALGVPDLDWAVCYQSRVGPLKWIGPATEDEIRRAAQDACGIILYPLAFVSEHSETLVELDIEYKELADEVGIAAYERVPTVQCGPAFIAGLADLVTGALEGPGVIGGVCGTACPSPHKRCFRKEFADQLPPARAPQTLARLETPAAQQALADLPRRTGT